MLVSDNKWEQAYFSPAKLVLFTTIVAKEIRRINISKKMANQAAKTLPSPHFFKLILTQTIQDSTKLNLPSRFVKKHGNSLSNYACLQVPNGAYNWQVEVKRRGHRVWLQKGWQDFVEYFSIKCGYFLMFRYEGKSNFRVFIFDTTTSEIQYPVKRVKFNQSKVIKIKEEDTDDVDERPPRPRANKSSKERTPHLKNALHKVYERAEAYKSPNPCFILRMQPSYVSDNKSCMYIPQSITRSHFHEKEINGIYLNHEEDGRSWFVEYRTGTPPRFRARFLSPGWSIFVKENHLQVGDVCVFELVNSKIMAYKVTIFRKANYA